MKTKKTTKEAKNLMQFVLICCLLLSTILASGTDGDTAKHVKKHEVKSSSVQPKTEIAVSGESFISEQENDIEDEEMEIEDWMLTLNEFYEHETEQEMSIENWMFDVHDPFWTEVKEAFYQKLAMKN